MNNQRLNRSLAVSVTVISITSAIASAAEPSLNWSHFHGDQSRGYVAEGSIPNSWTDSDYLWRHDLGSRDVGSPVIWDNRIYALVSIPGSGENSDDKKIGVLSLDLTTGRRLWLKDYSHSSYRPP